MVAYNNNDILMVPYEDLPDGDKGVITKAMEEFQNKCLLSYTKTCDNTIIDIEFSSHAEDTRSMSEGSVLWSC